MSTTLDAAKTRAGVKLARQVFLLRLLGLGLGAVAVGGVLYEQGHDWPAWALLFGNGYIWPFVAYALSRRSSNPRAQEQRNLIVDSAMGGLWIAVMQFNFMRSLLLFVTLTMDKLAFGGWKLLPRTVGIQLLTCALVSWMLGFGFAPESSLPVMLACVPHFVAYPLTVASVTHGLLQLSHRQRLEITKLARTDPLTGLLNRGHWEQKALDEIQRFQRSHSKASLLVIDIDHFKNINDRYGHLAGDKVIKAFADTISSVTGKSDSAGRYGGDEFVVVLPNATIAEASDIAQRIQARIREVDIEGGPSRLLSTSIGVAALERGIDTLDDWIGRADVALYKAKAGGRDRVVEAPSMTAAFKPPIPSQ